MLRVDSGIIGQLSNCLFAGGFSFIIVLSPLTERPEKECRDHYDVDDQANGEETAELSFSR